MDWHYVLATGLVAVMAASIFVDFWGHRDNHEMSFKESSLWSLGWIAVAIIFGGFIWMVHGQESATLYYSGYFLEKALSVDNLIVFTAVFKMFNIRCQAQKHKVLLYGIAGALIFRAIFVYFGTKLMNVNPMVHVAFAGIIAYSAFAMLTSKDDDEEESGVAKFVKEKMPFLSPLVACIIAIELSDVMFAFDSVPAVIGITQDPLLVYAAMMMAILGLRALYFVMDVLIDRLVHLEKAVIVLLFFVAAKMVAGVWGFHVDPMHSLVVVIATLGLGVVTSLVSTRKA